MNTFAQSAECPSIATIRHTRIIKAEKVSRIGTAWGVISEDFFFNKNDWNLLFTIKLPDASSINQAIDQTQIFLKDVILNQPSTNAVPGGGTICIYAESDDKHSMIATFNPPLHRKSFCQ
jgi:hypothetical protein